MTADQLRTEFDWSRTKPDMRDLVIRAVESQFATLVACCGPVRANTVIAWCPIDQRFPLSATNLSFRCGVEDAYPDESILAIRK